MLTTLSKIINAQNLEEIFAILKEDCAVKSAKIADINEPCTEGLVFNLKLNGVIFNRLILDTENENIEFLQVVSEIIAEKIKNKEFQEIMSQQIETLQEGILRQDNEKRIKNNFFASVTHELRTPLNAIIGYSELLSQGIAGKISKKAKDYLLEIQTSGLNLLNMINDILDFSRISAGQNALNTSEFDIERLFFEVNTTVSPLLKKKNLTLTQNIQNFAINGDYRKTFQIMINLLSNAIKYSNEGGKIELSSLISDKNHIIEVKDYGIGIPKRSQKKIFKEFTQASNNQTKESSTGLGLAIVKKFCDLHGWEIKLDSEENKGSTFRIEIN